MGFSDNLKAARDRASLSQLQLSEKSGVSQSAISAIENKGRSPSETTMKMLADALGCTVSELLGEQSSESVHDSMTADEKLLLKHYRELNEQGKKHIFECMQGALAIYIKRNTVSGMEDQRVG